MSKRIKLNIDMTLKSDTIFGCGYSVPAGDDISVKADENGYPYLSGSTFKGILRENLSNLLVWNGINDNTLTELLGDIGWNGLSGERRINLTNFTLKDKTKSPESCYISKVFTQLQDGIIKDGSLRSASCIKKGLCFKGYIECLDTDKKLLIDAIKSIKWLGTMRNRGFGSVKLEVSEDYICDNIPSIQTASCIRYNLHTDLPILMTDISKSNDNSYQTNDYISGSAIRGMVLSELASKYTDIFEQYKDILLSDNIKFLNALPSIENESELPPIMGFYGNKIGDSVVNVLNNDVSGKKRVKLGTCCSIDGQNIKFWSSKTSGHTRIMRQDKNIYQTHHINENQDFTGYILLDNPEIASVICKVLTSEIWIGADRFSGFGKCTLSNIQSVNAPKWLDYSYNSADIISNELYLLCISPTCMLNDNGEPCGIDLQEIAKMLEIENVKIVSCSTSTRDFQGYNRKYGCRLPSYSMYDRGSIFKLKCSSKPSLLAIQKINKNGLGIRLSEGFGQVLFIKNKYIEDITTKQAMENKEKQPIKTDANIRRAKYSWIMDNENVLYKDNLSKSQLGEIQAICEHSIINNGDISALTIHLEKNIKDRGAVHSNRFKNISIFINNVLETPLSKTLNVDCEEDNTIERLKLLCMLFDYSRKGK